MHALLWEVVPSCARPCKQRRGPNLVEPTLRSLAARCRAAWAAEDSAATTASEPQLLRQVALHLHLQLRR